MTRVPLYVLTAFTLGCVASSVLSGCSRPADRSLKIFQFQSMDTYEGHFKLDTSGLPPDAIETTVESGGLDDPSKIVTLNMQYEFEVVLRLVNAQSKITPPSP